MATAVGVVAWSNTAYRPRERAKECNKVRFLLRRQAHVESRVIEIDNLLQCGRADPL